jgi:hypothetical protein
MGDVSKLAKPTPEQLFQMKSEKALRLTLPEAPSTKIQPYLGRSWPHQVRFTVPEYVCYGRLFFEQLNFERYGWDLGAVTPFVSAGTFVFDVAAFPIAVAADPCRLCDCSAGYCWPGDPVPLLLYVPPIHDVGYNHGTGAAGK